MKRNTQIILIVMLIKIIMIMIIIIKITIIVIIIVIMIIATTTTITIIISCHYLKAEHEHWTLDIVVNIMITMIGNRGGWKRFLSSLC